MTLDALAAELGVSRARVEQVERKTLARMGRYPIAMEIELAEPEILVRLRLAELARRRSWSARRALLIDLGLDEREREIVARRLALRGGRVASCRAIGTDAGLSGERVRQIERDTLTLMLRAPRKDALRDRDPELLWLMRERLAQGRRWSARRASRASAPPLDAAASGLEVEHAGLGNSTVDT